MRALAETAARARQLAQAAGRRGGGGRAAEVSADRLTSTCGKGPVDRPTMSVYRRSNAVEPSLLSTSNSCTAQQEAHALPMQDTRSSGDHQPASRLRVSSRAREGLHVLI